MTRRCSSKRSSPGATLPRLSGSAGPARSGSRSRRSGRPSRPRSCWRRSRGRTATPASARLPGGSRAQPRIGPGSSTVAKRATGDGFGGSTARRPTSSTPIGPTSSSCSPRWMRPPAGPASERSSSRRTTPGSPRSPASRRSGSTRRALARSCSPRRSSAPSIAWRHAGAAFGDALVAFLREERARHGRARRGPLAGGVRERARVLRHARRVRQADSGTSRRSRSRSPTARWTSRPRAALVWRAARLWDAARPRRDALLASAYAISLRARGGDALRRRRVQLHGGAGFMRDYPVEKMMRDAKQLAALRDDRRARRSARRRHRARSPPRPGRVLPSAETQSAFVLTRRERPPMSDRLHAHEAPGRDARRHPRPRRVGHPPAVAVVGPEPRHPERVPPAHCPPRDSLGTSRRTPSFGGRRTTPSDAAGPKKERSMHAEHRHRCRGARLGRRGAPLVSAGAGLGGPPVRATGTPEQKDALLRDLQRSHRVRSAWGAYGLTEPGAGSDVAGIRTCCSGRQRLGAQRAEVLHHERRARLVDRHLRDHRRVAGARGAPRVRRRKGRRLGSRSGRSRTRWGLRASETAELVLEDCRVPAANLLGGEEAYLSKEGFMTAMKTFDNTRPIVAAMAPGIGRAAYEYAREFVKDHYVWPSHPALRGYRRAAREGREAARGGALMTYRAASMADQGIPNAKEASMCKAMGGQSAIRACIEAIEICGAEGSIAGRPPAPREVVPRHQGLRHLRGDGADPADRDLEAHPDEPPRVLTSRTSTARAPPRRSRRKRPLGNWRAPRLDLKRGRWRSGKRRSLRRCGARCSPRRRAARGSRRSPQRWARSASGAGRPCRRSRTA